MKLPTEQDPVARDAHLRAALRHAPDAEVGAPAHVSAQIVAAAYRAAGEGPAASRAAAPAPRRPWRLGASGAFASLVLAGVIGVLWRGEPPPAVRERMAEAPVSPAAVTPQASAPGLPIAAETGAAPERRAAATAPTAAPVPKPEATPAVDAERRAAARNALLRERPASPAAAQGRAVTDGSATRAPKDSTTGTAAPEPPAITTQPAKPDVAVAAAGVPPAPPPASPPAPQLAPPAAPPPASLTAPPPAPAVATAAVPAAPQAPAPLASPASPPPPSAGRARAAATDAARAEHALRPSRAAPARTAAAPPTALSLQGSAQADAPWLPAMAAGSAVQWRVDGQVRPAPAVWLQALAAQARGRWRPSNDVAAAGEREVQWQRGSTVLGRLWLNGTRVLWCNEDGRCEAAVLAPGAGADLLEGLPR